MFNKIYDYIKKFIKENYKFILVIILIFALFFIKLPYVINSPGGALDLNDRILVGDKNKTNGHISLSYVRQIKGNIPFVLLSFIIPNWDIVKVEDIKLDNQTLKESSKIDKLYLEEAIDNAIISAYTLADKSFKIKEYNLNVIYISDEAQTNLELFDEIKSINDVDVNNLTQIKNVVSNLKANEKVKITVEQDGKTKQKYATTYKDENDEIKIGIATINDYDLTTEPKIVMKTKNNESGPSGGLMMALSIYSNLINEDIIKNRDIIGTGTIDEAGNVGEIGGIKYKILGAAKKGADIFFCPQENYKEAKKTATDNKLDLKIVAVSNLKEAVDYLKK